MTPSCRLRQTSSSVDDVVAANRCHIVTTRARHVTGRHGKRCYRRRRQDEQRQPRSSPNQPGGQRRVVPRHAPRSHHASSTRTSSYARHECHLPGTAECSPRPVCSSGSNSTDAVIPAVIPPPCLSPSTCYYATQNATIPYMDSAGWQSFRAG